ncbi:proteasome subunit beta [Ignicoccus islandicus DSM 13165]|uniref:Proteasome subunit beta n=1 Tax=Ignicoccus islandicus DSM 13165 TaxID=940295 RepID=A0A0U3FIR5_9CREN|nr:archaeal proteasome endopeptidase complex subunit beta [Ignicoccus islandicus]ALU11782.1 proteasome subunit beta [Ignicoccus islandicus DSM 13165]
MSGYVGATAVGIKLSDAVVLAAEKRMSYGGFVMSKSMKKVFKIGNRMGMACAGLYADMQTISRIVELEVKRYELNVRKEMKVRSAARFLGVLLYSYKMFPLLTETVFGGIDSSGPHIFVLDPVGSVVEEKYAAAGSGAPLAIALLEREYREDMSVQDAKNLAIDSIRVASSRDSLSGDGVDVLIIKKGEEPIMETVTF